MSQATTARFADFVRGLFGLKGPESVAVLTDIMPVVNLMEEAGHLAILRDEHSFHLATVAGSGGAGTYAEAYIAAPLEGGSLVVVTHLGLSKATAGQVGFGLETAPGALVVAGASLASLDSRANTPPRPQTNTATPAAPFGSMTFGLPTAGVFTTFALPQPIVLAPPGPGGSTFTVLTVSNPTANETLTVGFWGYTVPLHGSEDAA